MQTVQRPYIIHTKLQDTPFSHSSVIFTLKS